MPLFYINSQPQENGEHQLHEIDCKFLPKEEYRKSIGTYDSCKGAIREAGKEFDKVNGCQHCCGECHS